MSDGGRGVVARVWATVVAACCLLAVRLAVGPTDAGLVLDAAVAALALAGTVGATLRAQPGRSRVAWRFQTTAVALWLLAPLAWLTDLPDDVAAVGRLGFVAMVGTGLWLTSRHTDSRSRVRLAVDAGMATASTVVVGWPLVLEDAWLAAGGGWAAAAAVGAPAGCVGVVVFAVELMLTEMAPQRRWMPRLASAGWAAAAVADVAWSLGRTPAWAVAWALWFGGTWVYGGTSVRREVISTRRALVHAPYLLLAPALVALVVAQASGTLAPVQEATAAVIAVLLLARQHVTLAENRVLVARLAASERAMRHQATHDSLTGLPARVLLDEELTGAIERRRGTASPLAVAFVDLDDFKAVNDTHGHAAGDDVLVATARRLTAVLAEHDEDARAFRVSGDEFAVLLVREAARDAVDVARQVRDAVAQPLTVNGHPLSVGASVGVATAAADLTSPSALLRAADIAMYEVKRSGKGGVRAAPAEPLRR